MSSPWASTQASASWPDVHALLLGELARPSPPARWLRSRFSPVKRGLLRRKSPSSSSVGVGEAARRGSRGRAGSRPRSRCRARAASAGPRPRRRAIHSEYSVCTAVIGCTACGAADRLRRGLAEPDVADLALLDQLGERADGLLDRRVRVDAVLVVEVDVVGAQPLQRALDRAAHVLGRAVERRGASGSSGVGVGADAELGGDDRPRRGGRRAPCRQLLVRVRPVDLGGVEEGAAELDRAVDRARSPRPRRCAVEGATCPCSRGPCRRRSGR